MPELTSLDPDRLREELLRELMAKTEPKVFEVDDEAIIAHLGLQRICAESILPSINYR
jgi:hypothetical protein